jgi:hypothetical protein
MWRRWYVPPMTISKSFSGHHWQKPKLHPDLVQILVVEIPEMVHCNIRSSCNLAACRPQACSSTCGRGQERKSMYNPAPVLPQYDMLAIVLVQQTGLARRKSIQLPGTVLVRDHVDRYSQSQSPSASCHGMYRFDYADVHFISCSLARSCNKAPEPRCHSCP